MLYPLQPCETQPLITIKNITLRNVKHTESLTPGLIRCNETNPCTGFEWNMVHGTGWWHFLGFNYITEHVEGDVVDSDPMPDFVSASASSTYENDNKNYGADLGVMFGKMMSSFMDSVLVEDKGANFKTAIQSFAKVYAKFIH